MALWLTVIGMGVITYAIRLSFLALQERVKLTAVWQRALQFVPPAVLSAIILPEIMQPKGVLDLSLGNGRLLAGLVAIVVAWRFKSTFWPIAAGMATLWLWQLAA